MKDAKFNLIQMLLKRARHLHDLGVRAEAGRIFQRLMALGELPLGVAEEIQGRLAEIRFDQGRFRKARRHLTAALAYQPDNAHYHYMMALAAEADPDCPLGRAYKHFRRSVQLDSEHPEYLCAYGLTALSVGRQRQGLAALRRAHRLAPDDAEVLAKVIQGLGEEGAWEEARELVKAALFRHPREAALRQLWQRLQFDALRADQEEAAQQRSGIKNYTTPVILPLSPPSREGTFTQAGDKLVRHDGPSEPTGPKQTKKPARKQ